MPSLYPLTAARPLPVHLEKIIEHGQWQALAQAFEDGLSPNLVYEGGQTLFGTVSYVLSETGPRGTTSAAEGPAFLVEAFIRHGLADVLVPSHVTSLVDVAASGQWGWIRPLLDAGHRVELPQGRSVLHALVEGRMARRLRGKEDQWLDDASQLCVFPFNSDLPSEVVQVRRAIDHLVAAGACLEAVDDEGGSAPPLTPLMLAVQYGDVVAASALLHCGALVSLLPGEDPMGINQAHPIAQAALAGLDQMLDLLLSHAGLDVIGHHGADAMHLAASRGHIQCMRILHDHGIGYLVATRLGCFNPLHQAALHGHTQAIDFLLSRGATWDQGAAAGLSAAAVLWSHHPQLARRYGVPREPGNVVALRLVGRGVANEF